MLLTSLETSEKPTYLDKMHDPEIAGEEDDVGDPDSQYEPDCEIVLKKCCSEMFAILTYVGIVFVCIVGTFIAASGESTAATALIEFGCALLIDQVKSIPLQFIIWWTVIRRCGKLPAADFQVWNDDEIFAGGVEPSLLASLR